MKRRLPIGLVCILLPILLGCTAMPSIDAPTTDAPKDAVLSVVTVAPTNAVTFTPVPTPTPSPAPTDAPTSEPDGLIGWTVGGFCPLEETAVTDTSYTSDKVHLTVQTITDTETFSSKVTYFVIDLYIRDLSVLRTQAAKGFDRHTNGDFLDLCATPMLFLPSRATITGITTIPSSYATARFTTPFRTAAGTYACCIWTVLWNCLPTHRST